jgi:GH18 family chitinase
MIFWRKGRDMRFLAVLFLLMSLVSGCDQGDDVLSRSLSISGTVFANQVVGAHVEVYAVTDEGQESLLGSTDSDSAGEFSLNINVPEAAALLIKAEGGTYTDEASGETTTLTRLRAAWPLSSDDDTDSQKMAVTPITEMAVQLSVDEAGQLVPAQITANNKAVAQAFFGSESDEHLNIVTTQPSRLENQPTSSSSHHYGLVLGALSQMQKTQDIVSMDALMGGMATELKQNENQGLGASTTLLNQSVVTFLSTQLATMDTPPTVDSGVLAQANALMSNDQVDPYVAGFPYAPTNRVSADGKVYECRPYPEGHWCRLAAYAPNLSLGSEAWTEDNTVSLPDSPASPVEAAEFVSGQAYLAGDVVLSQAMLYQCKGWPFSGWCSSRQPGVDNGWDQAWELYSGDVDVTENVNESTAPGKPVIATPPLQGADYVLEWHIPTGSSATGWQLLEDEVVLYETTGTELSTGRFEMSDQESGQRTYVVRVSNAQGDTQSDPLMITVSVDAIDVPTIPDIDRGSEAGDTSTQAQPAKPTMVKYYTPLPLNTDMTIQWNMWWGVNGNRWVLYEEGQEEPLHEEALSINANNAQSGSYTLSGGQAEAGEYQYYVTLCRESVCTESDRVSVTVSADSNPGDVETGNNGGEGDNTNTEDPTSGTRPALSDTAFPVALDNDMKVVAYYIEWGTYARDYQVMDIPAHKLTHLNYAFVDVKADGSVVLIDAYADTDKHFPATDNWNASPDSNQTECVDTEGKPRSDYRVKGNFKQLCLLQHKYPHLKILLSFGGWTKSAGFYAMAASADARVRFASEAVALTRKYGFDGIDLDWEFPVRGGMDSGSAADRDNYTAMINALHSQITAEATSSGEAPLFLTAAVYAGPESPTGIDYSSVIAHMDWVNIMSYDFHGAWEAGSGKTGHNAALYANNDHISNEYSVDSAVSKLLAEGVPAKKIVIGLAFYGRNMGGVKRTNNGYGQVFTQNPSGTWEKGSRDYYDLKAHYINQQGFQYFWDDVAKVPWLFNTQQREFVTFDDTLSIKIKSSYAKDKGLGGVMFWELSGDTRMNADSGYSGDLLEAIYQGFDNQNYYQSSDHASAAQTAADQIAEWQEGSESDSQNAANGLSFDQLPVQLKFNAASDGQAIHSYSFDERVSSVVVSNSLVADVVVDSENAKSIQITAKTPGRASIKLTLDDKRVFHMGLRINQVDGTPPGFPDRLLLGSVSEDTVADLKFWGDFGHADKDKNKRMDMRYIYINGGPAEAPDGGSHHFNSWRSSTRTIRYAEESLRYGLIPVFVWYNLPDGGESYTTDLSHAQSKGYMQAYFKDLKNFLTDVQDVLGDDLYGVILEPDFLGYMQQLSGKQPDQIKSVVNLTRDVHGAVDGYTLRDSYVTATYDSGHYVFSNTLDEGIAGEGDGTITDLVQAINYVIKTHGGNVWFGWQLNLWADSIGAGVKGVMRMTDADNPGNYSWSGARGFIRQKAESITRYALSAGILGSDADFISIDKYGLDAMGHQNRSNPHDSTWFFNSDHWHNYLLFVKTMHNTAAKPIVLWQLPIGHINSSKSVSAYTGLNFSPLDNSNRKYEDSTVSWFLGDSFDTGGGDRLSYFSQNRVADPKLSVSGDVITWGEHLSEVKQSGVSAVLFGAGVGDSTDGVGSPPSDDYFWIQKIQERYQDNSLLASP